MTTLIITLPAPEVDPADPATEWEHVRAADGVLLSPPVRAPLALLPTADDVVAVVPVQALSWHRVQLPSGTLSRAAFREAAGARLRAVLAGLLEDVLLDDPADLHFALEPGARDGAPIWVAACDRAWLVQTLTQLEKTGHRANRVVPQWTPQPEQDALWILGIPGDVWALRAGPQGLQRWPLSGALIGLLGDPGLPV
ncbi:MAG: general secretion pathway protein GspL, partial [Rhodoferax sp.]|nr:general secretion pathway protein GspL [Rhodoferax sp.]